MTDVNSQLIGVKGQVDLSVLAAADEKLRMSLLGQLYVADWKYLLAAAGRMYTISVPEHATGGGALTLATGNAAVDLDQPELVVPVGTGYRLIPVQFEISLRNDMDAYDDLLHVYLFADRTQTQGVDAAITGTNVTPQNHLDGGPAYPGGQVVSIVTADITDPVHSQILTYREWQLKQVASETAGNAPSEFYHHKVWDVPNMIEGPASVIGTFAGTVAPGFMASLTVGIVPATWFPVS